MLLPLLLWGFTHHVLIKQDAALIARAGETLPKQKLAWVREHPISMMCVSTGADMAEYRKSLCAPLSPTWQFSWARRVAQYTVIANVLLLLAAAGLGVVAFRSRAAQFRSLVVGWWLLAYASALEVLVQAAMLVWLSYWLPGFFGMFIPPMTLFIGIATAVIAYFAIERIFARSPTFMPVDGERIAQDDAPELFARIRAFAAHVGTAAPDHIVAGIDAGFFVTESELKVGKKFLSGRTLFVSLPLLRLLDESEADAILVHELAHLGGGDASSRAAFVPKLQQFDQYCAAMGELSAHHLLSLYRTILELAFKHDSREREFLADLTAAQFTSGAALIRALVKNTAYSSYRSSVEIALFERHSVLDESIGIAAFIGQGLQSFTHSEQFASEMEAASVPHPFDSHPTLQERMRNVGSVLPPDQYGALLTGAIGAGWITKISTTDEIEARLWADYEARFARGHEIDLAWRYLPEGDIERALVEKHFPAKVFALKRNRSLTVAFDGLILPGQTETLPWDAIAKMEYIERWRSDIVKLTMTKKGIFGRKTKNVELPGLKAARRGDVKGALWVYRDRHRTARVRA